MAECPTCGRDDFDSKAGMHRHYGAMHGSTKVEVSCATCGEQKAVSPHRFERNENFFCDLECRGEFDSETRRGGEHPNYTEEVTIYCDNCGSEDHRNPSHVNEDGNNFCSRGCYEEHQDKRVEVECVECGDVRLVQKSNTSDKNFCNNRCRINHHVGENHPRWRGGYEQYYGPTWPSQRRKTLERDEYECQDCGMSRDDHYEQWDKDLEVHHQIPFCEFDDTAEANKLTNLITLCKVCHSKR